MFWGLIRRTVTPSTIELLPSFREYYMIIAHLKIYQLLIFCIISLICKVLTIIHTNSTYCIYNRTQVILSSKSYGRK